MSETYTIVKHIPAEPEPVPLDLAKIRASIEALKVGGGFVIPREDLLDAGGVFKSTSLGQRIHALSRTMGVKVSTKKIAEGLRVRRES